MQDSTDDAALVLAEVLPGVAVVYGDVPTELELDLIDFGLVPAADRDRLSTVLASIGNIATAAGNIGSALAGMQGLYRLSDSSMALLQAGGTLAVKDGANLGTIMANGQIVGQARLLPVDVLSFAQSAATIGPALAMIGLQMQVSEVAALTRTNIAITGNVLATVRDEHWAELTGLVDGIDRAMAQARELKAVPASLWDSVAPSEVLLRKQCDLYQRSVRGHIGKIDQLGARGRRDYFEANAEAILVDTHALLSSVKAWTGYKALHAARARTLGPDDPAEVALVDLIARDTRAELDAAMAETTRIVDALTRELRVIVELPGRAALPLPGKLKDAKVVRETAGALLAAIEPLADVLHPPRPVPVVPEIACVPRKLPADPYLKILRWFLADGETLRALAFPADPDGPDTLSTIFNGAKGLFGAAEDKAANKLLVAVTDRRILIAKATTFLEEGEIGQDISTDLVRYVRRTGTGTIDVITRDENLRWTFDTDVDQAQVDALAAELAASMTLPETEREQLAGRRALPASAGAA
ncbi:hypothetical protein [Actinoplanes couchii]|uniref:Uncharacterized protein n=1 Tax=Actinoplanes couchii TaxID=403638 RepID=A0ABQ3XL97_9ACTN|nr:hypothetical protein [Actinoplanes couchii]MDR6318343.1 hypothetical protein [Actinoplanes couchii]GID59289.1 hypothetical protein Aco03nite_076930 [Actinoplanes couchii]